MSESHAHSVCTASELPPGTRRIVEIEGRSIGVFNVDGEFYAVANVCPHQRAPLCRGSLTGTTRADGVDEVSWERAGKILVCPWHGWEFDVTTGESVFNPHRWTATTYETDVIANPDAVEQGIADPAVETYRVGVDDGIVIVYV